MVTLAVAALLLAGLSAPAAAEPPGKAPAAPEPEREWGAPPRAATPDEQKLWNELKEGSASATLHLARLAQCAYRIQYGKYYEALDAEPRSAAKAAAREELAAAARAAQAVVPEKPGVYRCRKVHLDLDQRVDDPGSFGDVPEVKREAAECAARMRRLVAAVEPAADRLEAALARVDEALGRARPLPPPGAEKAPAADATGPALQGAAR